MKAEDVFLLQAVRFFDGTLSAEERREFEQRLRDDAEARMWLAHLTRQQLAVHERAAARRPARRAAPARRLWPVMLALAASVVGVLLISAMLWRGSSERLVTVAKMAGPVRYHEPGHTAREVHVGERLPAGVVRTESALSKAELVFADGTSIALIGEAEAGFSERRQKIIELNHGVITARVARQPEGRPLLVRTATAEVEVLGTEFALASAEGRTSLSVQEGKVKVTRLVDGQTVEVPAGRRVDASLDQRARLAASALGQTGTSWEQNFSAPPPEGWRGRWEDASDGGALLAVPHIVKRDDGGQPIVFHVIESPNAWAETGGALVSLEPESVLSIEFREEAPPVTIEIMLCTRVTGRQYAGNFFYRVTPTDGEVLPDGWRRVRVPLSAPSSRDAGGWGSPTARRLSVFALLVTSLERDTGLRVRRLEISTPSGT